MNLRWGVVGLLLAFSLGDVAFAQDNVISQLLDTQLGWLTCETRLQTIRLE